MYYIFKNYRDKVQKGRTFIGDEFAIIKIS